MRIGMMADAYKPYISGVTNYIEVNKKFLERDDHEVFVFTFGDEDYVDDEERVIRSPGMPIAIEDGMYFNLRYTREAQKLLHTMDIVHVHHPFISGPLAIRYTRGRGIPILFTNHTRYDLYAKAYLPILPGELSKTFLKNYMPSFCRSMDRVIAPSPGLRDVLRGFGVESEIEVVPNGVDMSRVQGEIEPIDRAQLNFTSDHVVLVYTGRLAPEKNLIFLLRAFAGISSTFDQARLVLIGDGPETENLKDRVHHMGISNKVLFTGRIPYEEVPRYLKMADAFVTASVTEVHPLSVIEAMGAGLPILGIVSPGVGDSVEDGNTGLLAQQAEIAEFTAKMAVLILDHEKRKLMGRNAKVASERFDIRRTSKLMKEQYQKALDNKKPEKVKLRAKVLRLIDRWTG